MAERSSAAGSGIKRILCIDGGGIKGACPASFLSSLEADLPEPIGRYFDLIAGTSTGGILAIGLALGLKAEELFSLYETKGPDIFGQSGHSDRLAAWFSNARAALRHLTHPKHDLERLEAALRPILKEKRVGDAQTRLIVPAWDAGHNGVYIYKTAHHDRLSTDYKKPMLDAALATAAAPTYFKSHKSVDQVGLIDGGVWCNNPTGIAAVEAISLLGWQREDLRILSLGCIEETYALPDRLNVVNFVFSPKLRSIGLLMDGQSKGALGTAKLITDHPHSREALFRYAAQTPKGLFALDDTSKIGKLAGLGASMAREAKPKLTPIFFHRPAEPFDPVHKLEANS